MDAIAVVILFATLFVGGNLWWVAFVFAVLVLFVIIRIRAVRAHPRS
jgi:membrane protein YdbS with pleckstrin-like domain